METYRCNHCDKEVKHNDTPESMGWIDIQDKLYCNSCKKSIVFEILDELMDW